MNGTKPRRDSTAAEEMNLLGARRRHGWTIGPPELAGSKIVPAKLSTSRLEMNLSGLQKELQANLHVAARSSAHSGRERAGCGAVHHSQATTPSVAGRATLLTVNGLASIVTMGKSDDVQELNRRSDPREL